MDQVHLSYKQVTNLGSYYTPVVFVDRLLKMVEDEIKNLSEYTIIDTSCGYGSFFNYSFNSPPKRIVGGDIDGIAIKIAKIHYPNVEFYNVNALYKVSRRNYNISDDEKIIIVGNPPYNDITSKVRMRLKQGFLYEIDDEIRTRDLGISFLLSYAKLQPDYVCVLHPLSYLIKQSNFELLYPFFGKYKLIDSIVINSMDFKETSKGTGFPIILALYKKDPKGIDYQFVVKKEFYTIEGKSFNINFDSIKNYITKYPRKYAKYDGSKPLFWTMRDINALKRSRTFVEDYSEHTIIIDMKKFEYYCYVDVFKEYIKNIPYYFGNCEIMIDNMEFLKIKDSFIARSLLKHPFLKKFIKGEFICDNTSIQNYFEKLLGKHYVH